MDSNTLYTIGHSTRHWDAFIALLRHWEIDELVDVRTVPKSRTYPWFGTDRMAEALPEAGIRYRHLKSLGGFRAVRKDSPNGAWENRSFRGYADYMQTDAFEAGIEALNHRREHGRVCVMCSEAVWWRCHRRMIADAETARGLSVRHIMSETSAPLHKLTSFAVVEQRDGHPPRVTYPAMEDAPGKDQTMAKDFSIGDRVSWNSEAGRVTGVIQKKVTSEIQFKGYTVHASEKEPQYLIQSEKTDHQAMHRGSALRKLAPKKS